MERRRHARTPVNINALLIGEKTVPKGCRIINVSQQGMLLYCDADGRLSTFNDGDTVDIHLTVQHAGEQKKLTVPAIVRHVAENSVDVEFFHPDPILMDLIESYRISDQHRLEATFGQNHTSGVSPLLTPLAPEQPHPDNAETTQRHSYRPLYLAMLTLLLGLCIVTGGYIYTASVDSRISTLETLSSRQADDLAELQNKVFSATLQEGRYASLNARMAALTDAFAQLETTLASTAPGPVSPGTVPDAARIPGDTGPPVMISGTTSSESRQIIAAAGEPAASTGPDGQSEITTEPPPAQAITQPTANLQDSFKTGQRELKAEKQEPRGGQQEPAPDAVETSSPAVTAQPPAQDRPPAGPWRINLLSSPARDDVTRLASKAARRDIKTHIEQTELKGRTWWRLQITGFSSQSEAATAAEPVKKALGIADVWILKQK